MERKLRYERNLIPLAVGLSGLLIGILHYLFFRTSDHVYFLRLFQVPPDFSAALPPFLAGLGDHLPSFVHVFSFSLLTAALLPLTGKTILFSCSFWTAINLVFELGQKYGTAAAGLVPPWFRGIPFLENTADFFRCGVFDAADMAAMAAAGIAAYLILIKLKGRTGHEKMVS